MLVIPFGKLPTVSAPQLHVVTLRLITKYSNNKVVQERTALYKIIIFFNNDIMVALGGNWEL